MVTISCVIPVVLSLNRLLNEKSQNTRHFKELITKLHAGLHERFGAMLASFNIIAGNVGHKDLGFDLQIFPMATSLDPMYSFHWLSDHTGTQQDNEKLRQQIIGKAYVNRLHSLLFNIIVEHYRIEL